MSDTVDTENIAYKEMRTKWDLIRDLMGGTTAMRAAGTKWLPKEPLEDDKDYKVRLDRSFLEDYYGRR